MYYENNIKVNIAEESEGKECGARGFSFFDHIAKNCGHVTFFFLS